MAASYTPSKDFTFYYVPESSSTVTEAVLGELDLQGERKKLSIADGDTRAPAFLALNPNGRVPVLQHEGATLWEASAITIYLGELFGVESGLWPAPGPLRGDAMKWVTWGSVSLHNAGNRIAQLLPDGEAGAVEVHSADYSDPADRTEARMKQAKQGMDKFLGVLDTGLKGREWLVGDGYTLADSHVAILVGWFTMMNVAIEPYKNLSAWHARCMSRPVIKKLFS